MMTPLNSRFLLFPLLASGILALTSCLSSGKNIPLANQGNPYATNLSRTSDTSAFEALKELPTKFKLEPSQEYQGESNFVSLNLSRDTIRYTFESRHDGAFQSVGIVGYGDFKIYQTGAGQFLIRGLIRKSNPDVLTGALPKWYSISLLAVPDVPLPSGTYRFLFSMVDNVKPYGRQTAIDSSGKVVYQQSEYDLQASWTGTIKLP